MDDLNKCIRCGRWPIEKIVITIECTKCGRKLVKRVTFYESSNVVLEECRKEWSKQQKILRVQRSC